MKHLFPKVLVGAGIVAVMVLSLSTHTFAVIGDCGKPLADIETILQRVETSKTIQPNDEALDKLFDVFREGVKREGTAVQGDKNKLTEFRNALKNFEGRLRAIESRIKNIEGRIKGGEIKLSKGVLQTMNQTEIGEFRKFLAPGALDQYEKLHPDIFKPATIPKKTTPLRKNMRQDIPDEWNTSVAQDFLNLLPDVVTPAFAESYTECSERCERVDKRCKRACGRCRWYQPHCCVCRAACEIAWTVCMLDC